MSEHNQEHRAGLRLTPTAPDHADAARQFDALAELFLGGTGDPVPVSVTAPPSTVQSKSEPIPDPAPRVEPPAPTPTATRPAEAASIDVLMLGHLPVRATPWVSQYVRAVASADKAPAIHVRIESGRISIRLFADDDLHAPDFRSLYDVLAWGTDLGARWVFQVTELDEPALAAHDSVDRVTLLTGADDAAVVAAYGTIKRFVEARVGWDEDHAPRVRVATMGSEAAAARAAFDRLERAAAVYLGFPVELAASIEKMGATGAVHLYEGELEGGAIRVIERIRRISRAARTRHAHEPAGNDARSPRVPLSHHLPGLRPLELACPDAPEIEFATDADGQLHLLARCGGAAVQELITAAAWTARHAAILDRAYAGDDVDTTAEPVMHLMTDRPAAIRDLLHTRVRCHILACVAGEWFCTPLN